MPGSRAKVANSERIAAVHEVAGLNANMQSHSVAIYHIIIVVLCLIYV